MASEYDAAKHPYSPILQLKLSYWDYLVLEIIHKRFSQFLLQFQQLEAYRFLKTFRFIPDCAEVID